MTEQQEETKRRMTILGWIGMTWTTILLFSLGGIVPIILASEYSSHPVGSKLIWGLYSAPIYFLYLLLTSDYWFYTPEDCTLRLSGPVQFKHKD